MPQTSPHNTWTLYEINSTFLEVESLDRALLYFINTLGSTPWLDSFFPAITDLHKSPYFAIIVVPLFLGLFVWKYKMRGFLIFLGLILCLGFSDFTGNLIKKNIQRPRPGDTVGVEVIVRAPYGGYSFISNHSINMFALATYSSSFIPPLILPTFALAAITAYGRVYNGVHYPSDVVFGSFLGILFGYLWSMAISHFIKVKHRSWY